MLDTGAAGVMWLGGACLFAVVGLIYVNRQEAKCPNCGYYMMRWKGAPAGRHNAFTLIGSGVLAVLLGVVTGGVCFTGGLLFGGPMLLAGLYQWKSAKGLCHNCGMRIPNSQMLALLSEKGQS